MFEWLNKQLELPALDETEISRLITPLCIYLQCLAVVSVVFILVTLIFSPYLVPLFIFVVPAITLDIFGLFLLRRSQVLAATMATAIATWLVFLAINVLNGSDTIAPMGYVVIIIFCGLTLGKRSLIIAILLCFISWMSILVVKTFNLLPVPSAPLSPLASWIVNSFMLGFASIFVYFVVRDVHRASQKAQDANAMLRQTVSDLQDTTVSKDYLQNIIKSMADALIVVDPDGYIELVNRGTTELLGYSEQELVDKPISIVFANLPPDRNGIDTLLDKLVVRRVEKTYLAKDGREIPVLFSGSVMRDQDGKIRAVCIAQDITQRKKAEQHKLELALEREKVAILSNFIRDSSHDLRTPLSIINTSVYLLRKTAGQANWKQYTFSIEQQAERLSKIVDGMLTMARLDNGPKFDFHLVEINRVVRDVCSRVAPAAKAKNITLSLRLEETHLFVKADEAELNQAIVNIITNAIQFTPNGKSVGIFTLLEDIFAVIEVRDTGIGISQDDLPHIFERFYRADKSRSTTTGGAGLGLSVAQRIIEVHGGKIEVDSWPHQGSLFRIYLPLRNREAVDTPV